MLMYFLVALLTGEVTPIEINLNDLVYAGSINNNGNILVKATRIGSDTELARITRMILAAQSEKAPAQQLADKISRVFVPVVLLLSIATFTAWYLTQADLAKSITTAVAVLVIACPFGCLEVGRSLMHIQQSFASQPSRIQLFFDNAAGLFQEFRPRPCSNRQLF